MKNQKFKAIKAIILFLLVTLGMAYVDVFGLAGSGKAEDIKLGLDLAGGVSITYGVVGDDISSEDMADTVYRLQNRVCAQCQYGNNTRESVDQNHDQSNERQTDHTGQQRSMDSVLTKLCSNDIGLQLCQF